MEKQTLLSGIDILISTPGRLFDHFTSNDDIASLVYYLDNLVLDECDRLLDMGFLGDILKINYNFRTA